MSAGTEALILLLDHIHDHPVEISSLSLVPVINLVATELEMQDIRIARLEAEIHGDNKL